MNKTIFFVAGISGLLMSCLLLSGCQQEELPEERVLSLETPAYETVSVPGEGGEIAVNVRSNLQWTVAAEEDGASAKWITFSKTSGTGDAVVTAMVAKGRSVPRSATVYVMSRDETITCSFIVNQEASDNTGAGTDGYSIPAYSIFRNVDDANVALGIENAVVEGAACIFDDGASLTMSGENASAAFQQPSYYQINAEFRGWGTEDASDIVMAIPVKDELSGDCRMFWGWTSGSASRWNVSVSADGENYIDTGETVSMSTSSRFNRTVFFTVPGTVPAGGTLYLKLTLASELTSDDYVRFCTGFLLTRSRPDETVLPSGDKVLYTCDFNNVTDGCPYDLPLGYLRSSSVAFDPAAFGYDGMSKSGTVAGEWGTVRIGSGSAVASLTFPALSDVKLGDGTADVKVSFKATLYQSADYMTATEGKASCRIAVSVAEGEGIVEDGAITDIANWSTFEERSVTIKGVSKNTRIRIGIEGGEGDRRFYLDDVVVEAISDIAVPSVTSKTLTEVLSFDSGTITGSWKTTVTVVSDPSGGNIPQGKAIVTDGTSYAALAISNAASLNPGTAITIKLTGASFDKDKVELTVSPDMVIETEQGSVPSAVTVVPSQLKDCEYHFVELKNVQAADAFVGKTFSSEVTMEDADGDLFALYVYPSAGFAGESIPEYSGSVKGIVMDGKLYPRTLSDINLVLDRLGGTAAKAFAPVFCTYEFTPGSEIPQIKNATISGSSVIFDNGGMIEKIGGTEGEMAFAQGSKTTPHNVYMYSTGWNAEGTFYRFTCPVAEAVSGRVAVTFSLNGKGEVLKQWNIFWSADGESWTPTEYTWNTENNTDALAAAAKNTFTALNTTSKGITRTEFTVPAGSRIEAGGKLYIKIVPENTISDASTLVQIGMGFVVAPGDIENTKEPEGALAFNNFSECVAGTDYMLGPELRYFGNVSTPGYEQAGWTVVNGSCRTGYTMYGTASSGNHGITTPALSGISGTADVTVTFKCCLYMPSTLVGAKDDICVKVAEGDGTAGELVWDSEPESDYYGWHTATVRISGATSSTKIFIGAGAGKATGDRRFFLDDIIVK